MNKLKIKMHTLGLSIKVGMGRKDTLELFLLTATYTLTSSTSIRLDMEAITERKPTPISLAQHAYLNLVGHNIRTILYHSIQI